MAMVSARRWPAVVAVVAVVGLSALAPLVVAEPATAAPRKGTTLQKPPALAQSGPVAFWSCPARTTEILVALNTLTLHPGGTLDLSFTVKNGGTASCNYTAPYAGVTPGPTTTALTAGPCGSVSFTVEDSHHHDVWPGAEVVNCPALGFAQLAAGATVSGSGSWNQDRPNSTRRVAPGGYTLVVGNTHISFRVRVDKS
ncbi:MAG: hypothetical protein WAL61_14285 [Acidimicrobiales bacterium]